jgi:hypothetical protein
MTQKSNQIGASQRGPAQLDTAKQNQGLDERDVTTDAEQQPLAAGGTVDSDRRRAQDPDQRSAAPISAPDDEDEDDDLDDEDPDDDDDSELDARHAAQPGGNQASESERPPGGENRRWGR